MIRFLGVNKKPQAVKPGQIDLDRTERPIYSAK